MKRPSFQFYPGDWLNDAALRMCSVGARGLWMDMLCLMHQGSEYGYLKVNHKVILSSNLSRMVGSTLQETEGWLSELESAGVFSKDDDGCIFSRRMIRDEEIRQARAAGGIKGGNPALKGKKEGSEKVDAKVNLNANLKPTPSSSSSSSKYKKTLSPEGDGVSVLIPYDKIFDVYEKVLCVHPYDRPTVKLRDDKRKAAIKRIVKARPAAVNPEWWETYFRAAAENEHWMKGDKHKGGTWGGANFDFLLRDDVFKRILEGAA